MTWRHPSGSKTLTGVKPSLICGPLKSGLLIMMLQFVAINQKFFWLLLVVQKYMYYVIIAIKILFSN